MMGFALDSRELRWLASQECISRATVMTRRTISSEVVFLCFPGSMPIATLARWIVLEASSGCLFHHSLTFSSCLASVSSLCGGSFKSFNHLLYWVSVNESGWLSTSQGSTDPGDTKRAAGSKVAEAAV